MSQYHRRTKIIVTLGPATDHENNLEKIIISGANAVRLNFSHGTKQEHYLRVKKVRKIATKLNKYITIIGDLQGPKIRISTEKNTKIRLKSGDNFLINTFFHKHINTTKHIKINYKKFSKDVIPGDFLLLDDGKIKLQVLKICNTQVYTKVITGGLLSNNKGINKLGGGLSTKTLTNKDKIDIIIAAKIGVDYLAISFPRNSIDLNYARKLVINAGSNAKIISKIERAEVVKSDDTIDDIIRASDAVMIARGDLGIEIGEPELVGIQKKIIKRAHNLNRIVITATQMMESMVTNSMPTRAEVMDVANAVLDGTDAVMLSAETAIGKYPSETVITMANICIGAEKLLSSNNITMFSPLKKNIKTTEHAIANSTMYLANSLEGINAIIILTESVYIALLMSCINSKLPIFVLSNHQNILNMVSLYRGVIPIYSNQIQKKITDAKLASNLLLEKKLLNTGELIIIIQDITDNSNKKTTISHFLKIK